MYEPYIRHIRDYYKVLFEVIAPLQITRGGPVIMMQAENEYGYYGDDSAYMEFIKNLMIENGCEVPLVTSDGHGVRPSNTEKWKALCRPGNFGSKAGPSLN